MILHGLIFLQLVWMFHTALGQPFLSIMQHVPHSMIGCHAGILAIHPGRREGNLLLTIPPRANKRGAKPDNMLGTLADHWWVCQFIRAER